MGAGAVRFQFGPAAQSDLERLLALKVAALRESLEAVGRFTPERARRRFVEQYRPQHTRLIWSASGLAGCVAFGPDLDPAWRIEHFYVDPAHQGAGLGGAVLGALLHEADRAHRPVNITVLRESSANRFYARFGFVETGQEGVDILYRREPL